MKKKLLGLMIFVLVLTCMGGGVAAKKALAVVHNITSSTYDRTTGDLVLTGILFDTSSTIDVTTLTITGVGGPGGAVTLTAATSNPTPTSATTATVVIAGADKTAVDLLLDTIGTVASDTTTYNLAAADNWQNSNVADPTTPITVGASAATVNLLTAGDFSIFANTGISSTGTTSIVGDIGVGPGVTSTAITGNFALTAPPTTYTTSALVNGKVYAYDYDSPTPGKVNQASLDMGTAFTAANARATTVLDAGSCVAGTCDLAGTTLAPGVYTFDVAHVIISDNMYLSGGTNSVWVFRIPGTLNISSAKSVILSGGATPAKIFWAVSGTTTLQTTSVFEGNILAGPGTSTISMLNGATLNGKALGQTAVTLIANTVVGTATPPAPSSDATLSNLIVTPSTGTITPFSLPIVGPYTITVPYAVKNVTITPTASEAHATITVNTVGVTSGVASASIPLSIGSNLITTEVTAQDASTHSYLITITREKPVSGGGGGGGSSNNPPSNNPVPGCAFGNLYNTSTGERCVNNGGYEIPGCGNRITGYSTATGESCTQNKVASGGSNAPGASGYNFGTATLRNGSRGDAVMELQRFLNKFMNLGLVVDGKFGPATRAAGIKFQLANGLAGDGLIGPATRAKMHMIAGQ